MLGEHSQGADHGEQGRHEQDVPHMVIAHVDKIKREQIEAGVAGAGRGLLQQVHLEAALEACPDGEEQSVEGDVPRPRCQVGVESVLDKRLLIPLDLPVLQSAVTAPARAQGPGGPRRGGGGVNRPDRARVVHGLTTEGLSEEKMKKLSAITESHQ